MCLTRRSTRGPEQSPNPEHFRDEGRLAFLHQPVESCLASLLMVLKTPHAVANRCRKLLINAQHGNFALVSLVSITQGQKMSDFLQNSQLRLASFRPDPDVLESHSCQAQKHDLQTAHSSAAVPPRAQSLGFVRGTGCTCTKNASSRDRQSSEGFCNADWTI